VKPVANPLVDVVPRPVPALAATRAPAHYAISAPPTDTSSGKKGLHSQTASSDIWRYRMSIARMVSNRSKILATCP
jgi:hypothetical protein